MANTLYDFYTGQGQKLPSIQERSKIYESSGLGSANTYQGTAQQNTALLGALQKLPSTIKAEDYAAAVSKPGTIGAVKMASTIDANSLTNIPEPVIPQMTTPDQAVDARIQAMGAIGRSTVDFYNNLLKAQQAPSKTETENSSLTAELKKQMEAGLGKGQALVDAQNQLGVPESVKQLQGLNQQIAQLQGGLDLGLANEEAQPIPMQFIVGRQAEMRRQAAAQIGSLATVAQAIQGNITLAKQTAQETVDLKYADVEQQIANTKTLIELNYDQMSREDKKKADELNIILNARQETVNNQKELENNIANVMIKAGEFNAPQNVLNKIQNSKTLFEAITNASGYLSAPETDVDGNWSIFEDNEGNTMVFDKNTGIIKPYTSTSDISSDYFTDANGTNWNITGWATDEDKVQKMQSISDRIGKVTDENLEAKVREFAPALTADMIRETSAKTGVSWEALLTMVNQESVGGTSNVARNNNNYAGLTWSENTQWKQSPYNGTKGTARPSAEGGNYIKFPTPQAGLDAMGALMAQYGTVIPKEQQVDSEVQSFVQLVNNKTYTPKQAIEEIDPKKKTQLISELAKTAPAIDEQSKFLATRAEDLQKHEGLDESVGYGLGRKALSPLNWAKKDDFIGKVQQMVDILTLNKLIEVKGQGATFGALSDSERAVIERAATPINQWVVKDKNGVVTGYKISESKFKEELKRIEAEYKKQAVNSLTDNIKMMSDGTTWELQPDGTYTQIT